VGGPIDEPTISELLRDVQSDVRRILDQQQTFVTKELNDRLHEEHRTRLTALEDSKRQTVRIALSSFLLPVLVALLIWLINGGK
jgi:hypothetical protein